MNREAYSIASSAVLSRKCSERVITSTFSTSACSATDHPTARLLPRYSDPREAVSQEASKRGVLARAGNVSPIDHRELIFPVDRGLLLEHDVAVEARQQRVDILVRPSCEGCLEVEAVGEPIRVLERVPPGQFAIRRIDEQAVERSAGEDRSVLVGRVIAGVVQVRDPAAQAFFALA